MRAEGRGGSRAVAPCVFPDPHILIQFTRIKNAATIELREGGRGVDRAAFFQRKAPDKYDQQMNGVLRYQT